MRSFLQNEMTNKKLKIGFVQYAIAEGHTDENAANLLGHARALAAKKPDLILLPEIFLGCPRDKSDFAAAAKAYRLAVKNLSLIAKKSGCHFYGSIVENSHGTFYNAAVLAAPSGRARVVYRKKHLFRYDGEHKRFGAGRDTDVFATPWGKTAPQICYDIRFPELLRGMVFAGAKIALVSAQWPESRRDHWTALLKARAIENQIYVLACNRTGTKNGLAYGGLSCAISPWGEFLCLLDERHETGFVQIDLDLVARVRKNYPFLKDAVRKGK